jgi:1-phosphofructokinase family hexose kinase
MNKCNSFYTVSLNPSIDYSFYLSDEILYDDINRVKETLVNAGGKGLNVARMLTKLHCKCVAITFLGGENGEKLETLLNQEGVEYINVKIKENVRSVYNFFSKEKVLRFNETGPKISHSEKNKLFKLFDNINLNSGDILVISGSLPAGIGTKIYPQIIKLAKDKGVYTILDSDREAFKEGIKEIPDIIKPNLWELERVSQQKISTPETLYNILENLCKKGISAILLTLGSKGALYFSVDYIYYASVPKIRVESTVGCGDTFLAGYLSGLYRGEPTGKCLRLAAASGTAKVMIRGTLMPSDKEITQIYKEIKVKQVKKEEFLRLFKDILATPEFL